MNKRFPLDILLVILLTALSLICIFILPFQTNVLNIISYAALALFLPGYALMAAIYPKSVSLKSLKFIFGSVIISALFTLVFVSTIKYRLLDISLSTAFIIIGILTIILSFDALEGKMRTSKKQNKSPETSVKVDSEYQKQITNKNDGIQIDESGKHFFSNFNSLDLILIFMITVISIPFILTHKSNDTINIILGFFLIFFIPGYSLVAALYPNNDDLDIVERLSLSFGFPLIGLAIGFVVTTIIPIALHLNYILLFIVIISLILVIVAYIRRRKNLIDEKFLENFNDKSDSKNSHPQKVTTSSAADPKDKSSSEKISNPRFVSMDLLLIFLTTLISIIFIITPSLNEMLIRTIFGFFLILFLPGYTLIAVLFPKKGDLDGLERAALSFGLSIAVTPLMGLALNYTPWGIKLTTILLSISVFTLIMIFIAFIRRKRVPKEEKYYVRFDELYKSTKKILNGESKTSKILSIIMILSIIFAISTTAYLITKPKLGESFTEFYLLGPGGKASDYPTNLTVGQNASVIIGIVNHEHQTVNYHLLITSDGLILSDQNLTVQDNNKIEIPYNFSLNSTGNKKIEFLLYKLPDNTNLYRSLHLFVNVTQ